MALRDKLVQLNKTTPNLDPGTMTEEWREAVNRLYSRVNQYLSDFIEDGLMSVEYTEVHREEVRLGGYDIKALILNAGQEKIFFNPVGRIVVGATGRVDVYRQGRLSDAMMLLRGDIEVGPEQWYFRPLPTAKWNIPRHQMQLLEKSSLEENIETLLS